MPDSDEGDIKGRHAWAILLAYLFPRFPAQTLKVFLLWQLGAAVKISALASILYLIRKSEFNRQPLLQYLPATDSPLLLVFILVFLLAVIGALITYRSRQNLVRLIAEVELHLVQFCLTTLPATDRLTNRDIMQLANSDTRACATVYRLVISIVEPLIVAIVALFILTILDLRMVFVCAIPLAAGLFFHLATMRRDRRTLERYKELSEAAMQQKRKILLGKGSVETLRGAPLEATRNYYSRLTNIENSQLINNLMLILLLGIFAIYYQQMHQQIGRENILLYFFVVTVFVGSSQAVLNMLVRINNLYPSLAQFARYLAKADTKIAIGEARQSAEE
jgi:ABC-type siderophore export system fused ATPase/permease subunit